MLKVYEPGFVMAAASIAAAPGASGWLGAALALVMLAIAAIDAHRFIIPDSLNAAGLTFGFLHAVVQADGDLMNALVTATLRAAMLALSFITECMSTCGCDYAKALGSATSSLRLRRRLAGMVRHGDRRGDRGRVSPWRVRAPAVRSSALAQGYRQVAVRALLGIRGPA